MADRCHVSIPRETWAYITILGVVVVGAMMREINLLLILAGLMTGPLAISWQMVRATLRDLELTRQLPRTVFPGDRLPVEIQVKNRRRRLDSWALVIEDRVQLCPPGHRSPKLVTRTILPHVAAGASEKAEYVCRLDRRGRHRLGPLRLKTRIPLGLLLGYRTIRQTNDVVVYPRLGRLSARWMDLARADRFGQQSSRRQQGPIEGDFYGLRDWRAGDSRRWIHWRSSAKRNSLLVRQFEQQRSEDFILLLDLSAGTSPLQPAEELAEVVERAVSFVATVIAEECRRATGFLIVGVAGETIQQVRGPASSALLDDALEMLAEVRPSTEDRLPELLQQILPSAASEDRLTIVSLRAMDLHDAERFPELPHETRPRQLLNKALTVDASADEFAQLFSWEAHHA
jgi:uncharacterized protein (DUF58 family)